MGYAEDKQLQAESGEQEIKYMDQYDSSTLIVVRWRIWVIEFEHRWFR